MNHFWKELKNTFENKSVFISGHTGFMGAWLTHTLHMLGAKVTAYALEPYYPNSLFETLELDKIHHSVIGDLRDKENLIKTVNKANPDFYFHLAAQAIVRTSYLEPHDTYTSNVIGTLNALESIRGLDKKVTSILITTDKVYENRETGLPFKEEDPMGGKDMYSSSKACCEILISSFVNSFLHIDKIGEHGKSVSTCRAGNVFGGGDWAKDRLVPDIVRSILADIPIEIRSPKAVRPWQHVMEPVFAYLLLAMRQQENPKAYASAYNLGPNESDALTVKTFADKAIEIWGKGKVFLNENPNAPHEAKLLLLDCTKVKEKLKWQPQFNVDSALEKTILWYKYNAENPSETKAFTEKQIMDYALNFTS